MNHGTPGAFGSRKKETKDDQRYEQAKTPSFRPPFAVVAVIAKALDQFKDRRWCLGIIDGRTYVDCILKWTRWNTLVTVLPKELDASINFVSRFFIETGFVAGEFYGAVPLHQSKTEIIRPGYVMNMGSLGKVVNGVAALPEYSGLRYAHILTAQLELNPLFRYIHARFGKPAAKMATIEVTHGISLMPEALASHFVDNSAKHLHQAELERVFVEDLKGTTKERDWKPMASVAALAMRLSLGDKNAIVDVINSVKSAEQAHIDQRRQTQVKSPTKPEPQKPAPSPQPVAQAQPLNTPTGVIEVTPPHQQAAETDEERIERLRKEKKAATQARKARGRSKAGKNDTAPELSTATSAAESAPTA